MVTQGATDAPKKKVSGGTHLRTGRKTVDTRHTSLDMRKFYGVFYTFIKIPEGKFLLRIRETLTNH